MSSTCSNIQDGQESSSPSSSLLSTSSSIIRADDNNNENNEYNNQSRNDNVEENEYCDNNYDCYFGEFGLVPHESLSFSHEFIPVEDNADDDNSDEDHGVNDNNYKQNHMAKSDKLNTMIPLERNTNQSIEPDIRQNILARMITNQNKINNTSKNNIRNSNGCIVMEMKVTKMIMGITRIYLHLIMMKIVFMMMKTKIVVLTKMMEWMMITLMIIIVTWNFL